MTELMTTASYDPLLEHNYSGLEERSSSTSTRTSDSVSLNVNVPHHDPMSLAARTRSRSVVRPTTSNGLKNHGTRSSSMLNGFDSPLGGDEGNGSHHMPPRLPSPSHLMFGASPPSKAFAALRGSPRPKKKTLKAAEYQASLPYAIKTVSQVKRSILKEPKLVSSTNSTEQKAAEKDDEDEEFVIEKILKKKRRGRKIRYLVKWVGYEDTTWEPPGNLGSECKALAEFRQQEKDKGSQKVTGQKTGKKEDGVEIVDESLIAEAGSANDSKDDVMVEEVQHIETAPLLCTEERLGDSDQEMTETEPEPVITTRVVKKLKRTVTSKAPVTISVEKPTTSRNYTSPAAYRVSAAGNSSVVTMKPSGMTPVSPEIPFTVTRPTLWTAPRPPPPSKTAPKPRPFTSNSVIAPKKPPPVNLNSINEPPFVKLDISAPTAPVSSLMLRSQVKTTASIGVSTEGCFEARGHIPVADTGKSGLDSGALVVNITGFKPRQLAITSLEDVSFLVTYADREAEFVDFSECIRKIPMEVANFLFKNHISTIEPLPIQNPLQYT